MVGIFAFVDSLPAVQSLAATRVFARAVMLLLLCVLWPAAAPADISGTESPQGASDAATVLEAKELAAKELAAKEPCEEATAAKGPAEKSAAKTGPGEKTSAEVPTASAAAPPAAKIPSGSAHEPARQRLERGVEWEMLFEEGISAKEYAKQLDYFKIEIGVEDSKGQIEYASHFSDAKPERRIGNKQDEGRLAESWKKGTLSGLDHKLLHKAGIKPQGKKLLHFYPREIEREMFKLEQEYAGSGGRQLSRTRFTIRPKTLVGGYELFVSEQQLKTESPGKAAARYSNPR